MRVLPILAVLALVLPCGVPDRAAADEKEPAITLSLTGQSVHEALERVFQQAHLPFKEDTPAVTGEVRAQIENVPLPVALRLILRQAKPPLTFRVEEGVYHIISPQTPETIPPVEKGGVTLPQAAPGTAPAEEPAPWIKTQLENLRALGREYGVQFVYQKPTFKSPFAGEEAPIDRIATYVRNVLVPEWKRYPVSLVKRTRLRRVVLCRNLNWLGHSLGGVAPADTFYVNIGMSPSWSVHSLHHEFFHTFDHFIGDSIPADQWEILNPPGFNYGAEGNALSLVRESSAATLTEQNPGFFNRYCASSKVEDRAEVFAYMMADPQMVSARMAKDPVIAAKVRRVMDLMNLVCPEMDAAYWTHVFERGRPKPKPSAAKPA